MDVVNEFLAGAHEMDLHFFEVYFLLSHFSVDSLIGSYETKPPDPLRTFRNLEFNFHGTRNSCYFTLWPSIASLSGSYSTGMCLVLHMKA